MGFKENLRFIRQAEGYTQQTLAEAMGVSRPTVTQWESGWSEPRMGTIKQIAATLNVSVADLISDTLPDVETIPPSTREEKRLLSMFRRLDRSLFSGRCEKGPGHGLRGGDGLKR